MGSSSKVLESSALYLICRLASTTSRTWPATNPTLAEHVAAGGTNLPGTLYCLRLHPCPLHGGSCAASVCRARTLLPKPRPKLPAWLENEHRQRHVGLAGGAQGGVSGGLDPKWLRQLAPHAPGLARNQGGIGRRRVVG